MAVLAALLESLCLGDGGSLLCALCTWLNALCAVLSLYEAYSADRGCRYLWVFGLDKRVKSLLDGACWMRSYFFDGDFCLCRVSYSLRWLLMSNGSCRQMNYWQVTWFCEND